MQSLRIVPHLRSSVVEEMPEGQVLLYTSRRADADAGLLAGAGAVLPFSWPRLLRALIDPDLELLEVAEPLWLAEWVRAVRYAVLVRVLRRVVPGRRRVMVATYAIENLDARRRLSFPSLDRRPVRGTLASGLVVAAVGASLLLLDLVAFGTAGAQENYRRAFGWSLRRTTHAVLPAGIDPCRRCGPGAGPRAPVVLFLGAPSERKGFGVLMDAWERCGGADAGWRLVVADPGGDADPPLPPGASIRRGLSRPAVHELLRSCSVVAMPSVRLRRWREQIGLPLVEGLAHGCRVVTTRETGLADDLRHHPLVVFTTPGDPDSLAAGLRRAMTAPPGGTRGGAGYSKSDVVAWWLSASGARTTPGTAPAGAGAPRRCG